MPSEQVLCVFSPVIAIVHPEQPDVFLDELHPVAVFEWDFDQKSRNSEGQGSKEHHRIIKVLKNVRAYYDVKLARWKVPGDIHELINNITRTILPLRVLDPLPVDVNTNHDLSFLRNPLRVECAAGSYIEHSIAGSNTFIEKTVVLSP